MEQHRQCRLQWTITIYNIDNSTVLSPPLVIGASVACYWFLAKNVLALQHRISWSSPGLLDDCRQLLPRKTCPSLTVLCCALDTRKKDATHILRGKLWPITDLLETFDQLRSRNNDFLTSWKCLPRDWAWTRSHVRKEQLAGDEVWTIIWPQTKQVTDLRRWTTDKVTDLTRPGTNVALTMNFRNSWKIHLTK